MMEVNQNLNLCILNRFGKSFLTVIYWNQIDFDMMHVENRYVFDQRQLVKVSRIKEIFVVGLMLI